MSQGRQKPDIKIDDILDRVKSYIKSDTDADIARALGVSPQSINNWRRRGTIPWGKICTFAQIHNLSYDWLLTGSESVKYGNYGNLSVEIKDACLLLIEILQSGDEIVKSALINILHAFIDPINKNNVLQDIGNSAC